MNQDCPYPNVDPEDFASEFAFHMDSMTRFGLNGKSEIAEQLAWRDRKIKELEQKLMFIHSKDTYD